MICCRILKLIHKANLSAAHNSQIRNQSTCLRDFLACSESQKHNASRRNKDEDNPCTIWNDNKENLRKVVAEEFFPRLASLVKVEYNKGTTYFERYWLRKNNGCGTIFNDAMPYVADELLLQVFFLLDYISNPSELLTVLKVIRDSYKHDHTDASLTHHLPHTDFWCSRVIYESMNEFTLLLIKMFQDFKVWKLITHQTVMMKDFLRSIFESDRSMKLEVYQIKRCCHQYALFCSLYIAKYIGLFPSVDSINWTFLHCTGDYSPYNIFQWMLYLLKLKKITDVAIDQIDESLEESDIINLNADSSFFCPVIGSGSLARNRILPLHHFYSTVLKKFANLFISELKKMGKLPWTFQEFLRMECHHELQEFFKDMCNDYVHESRDFFMKLLPNHERHKKKRKILNSSSSILAVPEPELAGVKDYSDDDDDQDDEDDSALATSVGTSVEVMNASSSSTQHTGANEQNNSAVAISADSNMSLSVQTVTSGKINETMSFFASAMHLFVLGLEEEALNFEFKYSGESCNTDKFIDAQIRMKAVVNKLVNGNNLGEDDLLSVINLSMLHFQDSNGIQHLKFTSITNAVEQDIGVAVDFMVLNFWSNLLLYQTKENGSVSFITIEPTVKVSLFCEAGGEAEQCTKLCSDLKSSLLYHQSFGEETAYQFTRTAANYFIVKVSRVSHIKLRSTLNNRCSVDTTNILNTEAVSVLSTNNKSFHGMLNAFVVVSEDFHFMTFAKKNSKWVFYDGDKVQFCDQEVSQITGFGYILLYKTCSQSMYDKVLQQASKVKESLAKQVHDRVCIYACIHQPAKINEVVSVVAKSYKNEMMKKHLPTVVVNYMIKGVINKLLAQYDDEEDMVGSITQLGYRLLLQDALISHDNNKLAGQSMLHNWWQNLQIYLSPKILTDKIYGITGMQLDDDKMTELTHRLNMKLIEITKTPYKQQLKELQFCTKCHVALCMSLGSCIFCHQSKD